MHNVQQSSNESIAMDALIDDRDVLLLARSKDLQDEYENLVRSLDAAYDAVRQINTAMSENRLEAKRVFQERLELLASRPKRQTVNGDAILCNTRVDESMINRGSNGVTRKTLLVTGAKDKVARYVIALATGKNKGATKTTSSLVAAQNNSSRVASDAIATNLIYYTQQKTNSQRVGTKGYVGDEHSYAEIDTKTGLLGHSVTQNQEENSVKPNGTETEVDLSIVKSEIEDESNDYEVKHDSIVDDPSSSKEYSASDSATTLPAISLTSVPKLKLVHQEPYEYKIQVRRKNKQVEKQDEEAIKRKRVMTRNRMRRWRAKKRLEQMTTADNKKYAGL